MPQEYKKVLTKASEENPLVPLAQDTEEDKVFNLSLRPSGFENFIGQKNLVGNLKVSISAARQRGEPLEHVLLSGPPGLGKTTLAHIITNQMSAKITATSGPAIERAGDLIGILTNLGRGDVFFIDEIHRLSKVVEEFLYPAMENFQIDFLIDKGPYAKTIKFNLKPFTLIGATTRQGLLSSPLRGRFGIFHHLDFYEPQDLAEIITNSAAVLGVKIDQTAALGVAGRARGTPRIANRLLRRVRDYAQVGAAKGLAVQGIENKNIVISTDIVNQALDALGIDKKGFDEIDRKVLLAILENYDGGPVGVESLAATLNEEVDTLVDAVEPYLLKTGYLKRTSRGRLATKLAFEHFGMKYNKAEQGELF